MSMKPYLRAAPQDLQLRGPIAQAVRLTLDSPAIDLLTDFHLSPIITVPESLQIDRAIEFMAMAGVRFCFVVDVSGRLLGCITSYDIQGEKPLRFCQAAADQGANVTRADVRVSDIMERVGSWQILDFDDVTHANVRDVIGVFNLSGRRHLVVVENLSSGNCVRGVFSATRFEAVIGHPLEIYRVPDTFVAIEQALADH